MKTKSEFSGGISDSWKAMAPFIVPPLAAAGAIIPTFGDQMAKSAQQLGMKSPKIGVRRALISGVKASPTVGTIVGAQMVIQRGLESQFFKKAETKDLSSALTSSAAVGALSAPILAVYNGRTMGWPTMKALRNFTPRQAVAISIQEGAFVGGLSVADELAERMRPIFGDNKFVDYSAAAIAGVTGSIIGHPANTALTRWQNGLKVNNMSQAMWGVARKARSLAGFGLLYKAGKDLLSPTDG